MGKRFQKLPAIPEYLWDLITRCWQHNPDDRPSFATIVDELKSRPEDWAFPGTDMEKLKEYMDRITQPVDHQVEVDIDVGLADLRMSRSSKKKRKFDW